MEKNQNGCVADDLEKVYNSPPVEQQADGGYGEGDLEVPPVADEVDEDEEQQHAQAPRQLHEDAHEHAHRLAHDLHA